MLSTKKADNGKYGIPKDSSYNVAYSSLVKVLRSVAGMDPTGVSTAFDSDGKKNSSSPFYDKSGNYANPSIEIDGKKYYYKDIGQTQGLGINLLAKYGNGALNKSLGNYKFSLGNFFEGTDSFNDKYIGAGFMSTKVQKLNDGQVTQYPYLTDLRFLVRILSGISLTLKVKKICQRKLLYGM